MRLIDADRLLTNRMKSTYYHLQNGDIAIPIIDIEHALTIEVVPLDKLCDWLAARYEPPMKLDDIEFLGSPYEPEAEEHRRIVWLRELRDWMQKEGLNEVDRC